MDIPNKYISNLYKALLALFIILSVFFAVKVMAELKSYDTLGNREINTITLSGHGEVQAVPDLATIYFTVEGSKDTQAAASDEVNTKTKKVLDLLKSSGVEEKDIKTEGYNSYPKYSNPEPCPFAPNGIMLPCFSSGESKIIGYTVYQSVSVKIRKADDASKIIDGINKIGVTNMSGPNFTIDDEEAFKREARKEAIEDAKEKARILADDLGVDLGRIASFSESGNYYPVYGMGEAYKTLDSITSPAPAILPAGENTISADVTITYEIN